MTSRPAGEPLSLSDALAQEFPSIESLSISYLQSTPGDGYPGTSVSWDPSKGDRLECSNSACLKGGVAIAALLSPIVATAEVKAVRRKPCSGQERLANGSFRPCANQFMIAVELRYTGD